jgi:hypothetical protein
MSDSTRTARRMRNTLAAGSLLCTTALASAQAWTPMTYMKVMQGSVTLNENGTYGTSNFDWLNLNGGVGDNFLGPPGYTNATATPWGNTAAGGEVGIIAANLFGLWDQVGLGFTAGTGVSTAGGTFSGWIDVYFSADSWVYFQNTVGFGGDFYVNSILVQDGDFFAQGSTVRFDMNGAWSAGQSGANINMAFVGYNPGGGAVPMPGAAGLAACGLALAGRRRRRG